MKRKFIEKHEKEIYWKTWKQKNIEKHEKENLLKTRETISQKLCHLKTLLRSGKN